MRCASDAHGKHEHQKQDRHAEPGAPVLGRARERILQPDERRRTQQRAGERIESAEQDHDQRIDRTRNRQRLGRDAAFGECVDTAGQAGKRAGERERCPARRADVDAGRLGAERRVAAGAQRVAERGLREPRERNERTRDDRERQIEIGLFAAEPRWRPDADQSVRATGDAVPLERD